MDQVNSGYRGMPIQYGAARPQGDVAQAGSAASAGAAGNAAAPKRTRVRKTVDQQIAETEERLRRLKAQARSEERKARTKRLIETGAVVESALGMELATQEQREALAAVLREERAGNDGSRWTWAAAISDAVTKRADGGDR